MTCGKLGEDICPYPSALRFTLLGNQLNMALAQQFRSDYVLNSADT